MPVLVAGSWPAGELGETSPLPRPYPGLKGGGRGGKTKLKVKKIRAGNLKQAGKTDHGEGFRQCKACDSSSRPEAWSSGTRTGTVPWDETRGPSLGCRQQPLGHF